MEGEEEGEQQQQEEKEKEKKKSAGEGEKEEDEEEGRKEGKEKTTTTSSSSSSSSSSPTPKKNTPSSSSSSSSSSSKDKDLLDPLINSRLICPHMNLLPPPSNKKPYRLLPGLAWNFFHQLFPHALPLLNGTPPCPSCLDAKISLSEFNLSRKKERDENVNCKELRDLAKRKTAFPPSLKREIEDSSISLGGREGGEGKEYVFVNRAWLEGWKEYVSEFLVKEKPGPPRNEKGLR